MIDMARGQKKPKGGEFELTTEQALRMELANEKTVSSQLKIRDLQAQIEVEKQNLMQYMTAAQQMISDATKLSGEEIAKLAIKIENRDEGSVLIATPAGEAAPGAGRF